MFRLMEEQELEIRNINDIGMIHFYGLMDAGPAMNSNDRLRYDSCCPGIAVFYNKNRLINLCILDKYYKDLLEKVFEYYRSLNDKSGILMDENTRNILEAGTREERISSVERYLKPEALEEPVIYMDSVLSSRFFPVVEYFLEAYYKLLLVQFVITGRKKGWRGSNVIHATQAGEPVVIFFKVVKENDSFFAVKLSNFINVGNELLMNIHFEEGKMTVSAKSDYLEFDAFSSYTFDNEGLHEEHSVSCRGKQIYADGRTSEPIKNPEFDQEVKKLLAAEIAESEKDGKDGLTYAVYDLPFDIRYVLIREKLEDDSVAAHHFNGIFVYNSAKFADLIHWTRLECKNQKLTLYTDNMHIQKLLTDDGRVQAAFLNINSGGNGEYKEKLEGTYRIFD